jgi:GntR family transcriptional regulator of arabinose operon
MIGNLKMVEEYLFHCLEGVTGVVCYNDAVASSLLDVFEERGIRVPEDMSIVGIDDANLAQMRNFTSIPHPKEELGRRAASNLLHMIENPSFDGNCLFDAEPVLRDSVKKIGSGEE